MSPQRQLKKKQKTTPIAKEKGFSEWVIKLLTISGIAILFIAVINYLTISNTKKINAKKISELESQSQRLKESNLQAEISLNTSIDYNEIYKTATEELGMVYPNEEQIIRYSSDESEYVIQFSPIPDK